MRFALLGLLLISCFGLEARADQFALDKQHTDVRFSWDHLGLSRQSGKFTDLTGTVMFDSEKPEATTVNVTIPVASMMTGVPPLDAALVKSKDYFDVAAHPLITFKSTGVKVTSDKTAELAGDLTINGVTKPVTLAVVWNYLGQHPLGSVNPTFAGKTAAGFSARTQILRSEWGISRLIPLVSDEIRISIEAEMHRQE
jgi:polyisoprenoid-binding protein YceI